MNTPPRRVVEVNEFLGVWSNVDHRDVPDAAATLAVNIGAYQVGILSNRPVMREVQFEKEE